MAKAKDAKLIEINAEGSELTQICDIALRKPAGVIMPKIMDNLASMVNNDA